MMLGYTIKLPQHAVEGISKSASFGARHVIVGRQSTAGARDMIVFV